EVDRFPLEEHVAEVGEELVAYFIAPQRARDLHRERAAAEVLVEVARQPDRRQHDQPPALARSNALDPRRLPGPDHRTHQHARPQSASALPLNAHANESLRSPSRPSCGIGDGYRQVPESEELAIT